MGQRNQQDSALVSLPALRLNHCITTIKTINALLEVKGFLSMEEKLIVFPMVPMGREHIMQDCIVHVGDVVALWAKAQKPVLQGQKTKQS